MSRELEIAERIVKAIEDDLNDRRGFHLDSLDEELQAEIRKEWIALVMNELKTQAE